MLTSLLNLLPLHASTIYAVSIHLFFFTLTNPYTALVPYGRVDQYVILSVPLLVIYIFSLLDFTAFKRGVLELLCNIIILVYEALLSYFCSSAD